MRTFLATCVLLVLVGAAHAVDDWESYKANFGKSYKSPAEDLSRRKLFEQSRDEVERFNRVNAPYVGYYKGINHMSDWTQAERDGLAIGLNRKQKLGPPTPNPVFSDPPTELDWRKTPNRVSPVLNQGSCGDGWAFAATGMLEGRQVSRNISSLVPLSPQMLLDCGRRNPIGCVEGSLAMAYMDIEEAGGVMALKDYPYKGEDRHTCNVDGSKIVMSVNGVKEIQNGDEALLQKTVTEVGPVAVSVYVTNNMLLYKSGVFHDRTCQKYYVNHGVLVVGYGTDTQWGDYWLLKFSFGERFGENGYLRLARNRGNMCGVASIVSVWL